MNREEHQRLRELLGSHVLGHLDPATTDMLRAHLDGCADCRAELAELEPLAEMLDLVDPARFADPPAPPADLGETIRSRVAQERSIRDADELDVRRARARRSALTRAGLVAAGVALMAGSLVTGLVVGRSTAPEAALPRGRRPHRPCRSRASPCSRWAATGSWSTRRG